MNYQIVMKQRITALSLEQLAEGCSSGGLPRRKREVYQALSWSRLHHTDAWTKLENNLKRDYQKIMSDYKTKK